MDNQLQPSLLKNRHITIVLSIAVLVLLVVCAYLFVVNQELATTVRNVNRAPPQPTKSVSLPFDLAKKYVVSTTVYQQVAGQVVSYDKNSSILTLKKAGEDFTVKLPLGPNADYHPPSFADVSGMYRFQVGDEVVIGGQSSLSGQFEITRFVITNDQP